MTHSTQTISPLRQRMIDDMLLRKMRPRTQQAYLRAVKKLARFLGRSPHTATAEDRRQFQLHLVGDGVSSKTINATITGLKFLFEVTLDDRQVLRKMSTVHEPRRLPVILTPEEVRRLLEAASSLKFPVPQIQIPIGLAYTDPQRSTPAVSYLGAYPPPAR
jgi:integrase/recombinase XerD